MKLHEFLQGVKHLQFKAAVYDELIAYLQRCLDTDIEIPVDIEDGRVPDDAVRGVMEALRGNRDELISRLELVEDAEVSGVSDEVFGGD